MRDPWGCCSPLSIICHCGRPSSIHCPRGSVLLPLPQSLQGPCRSNPPSRGHVSSIMPLHGHVNSNLPPCRAMSASSDLNRMYQHISVIAAAAPPPPTHSPCGLPSAQHYSRIAATHQKMYQHWPAARHLSLLGPTHQTQTRTHPLAHPANNQPTNQLSAASHGGARRRAVRPQKRVQRVPPTCSCLHVGRVWKEYQGRHRP